LSVFICSVCFFTQPVLAASNQSGLANYITVSEPNQEEVIPGAIVVYTNSQYALSSSPYAFKLIGVVTSNPPIAIDFSTNGAGTPVAISGVADVLVSSENGEINSGDLVTTSSKKGVGMKAVEAGYVLGIALSDYKSENADAVGTIPISLEVDYSYNPAFRSKSAGDTAGGNLRDILSLSSVAVYESPTKVFKYLVSALILFGCLTFAFLTFSRVARNGVDAIGRNPLAKNQIQMSIVFNILLSFFVIAAGVAVAYFILRL